MIGTDVDTAAALLTAGKAIGIPTETVYGLAANALNPDAVLSIFTIKNRPAFNPLIVHVSSVSQIGEYTANIPPAATQLLQHFSPGPLTLVLPKKDVIPDLVTAGSPTVAIRVPAHPVLQQLLTLLPFPLAAPSANPFGYISPTTAAHVQAQLGSSIPYVLDGGQCTVGIESTIVGFADGKVHLLRHGGIAAEALAEVLGYWPESTVNGLSKTTQMPAPGMLASHYAPRTPLHLGKVDEMMSRFAENECGIINFCKKNEKWPAARQAVLAPTGTLEEAAKNLFSTLRAMDAAGCRQLLAELVEDTGLGRAINDRLRRACVNNF